MIEHKRHAVLILAAGNSSRLSQSKQQLVYHGQTLLMRTVALAQTTRPERVLLSLGANANQHWDSLDSQTDIERLDVNDWQTGMSASLRAAAHLLQPDKNIDGLLVMLVDQYRVNQAWLDNLLRHWRKNPVYAAASSYRNAKNENIIGVPALLPRIWFQDLADIEGDHGARELLRNRIDVSVYTSSHEPGDIDYLQQADKLRTSAPS